MCGIAGFWQTKRCDQPSLEILERMGASLRHRGPNDVGSFFDSHSGIGMVHRRLSILDLSPAGRQPMTSFSGRITIVFNGEVYNFSEIKKELGSSYQWRGHSDTEVILEAIEHWGLHAALRRFVGMFALAVWDRHEHKLYLVRDRLGIKPLYYGWIANDFVFASELKAISRYPMFEGRVDRDALALYMRHNYVPAPYCIYEDLYKLPPASVLSLSSTEDSPAISSFWSATQVAEEGLQAQLLCSDSEAISKLEDRLREAIGLRMIADVPLGAFLSGGIDSSTV